MHDQEGNNRFDERVEAYLTERMSEAEEAAFCEELLESADLRRQVMETALLRNSLAEHAAPRGRLRWLPAFAAAIVGLIVGGLFLSKPPEVEPVITGAPYTVAGQVRGGEDVLVVPFDRNGVTLLFPGGRCKAIQLIEIVGPGGKVIASSRMREDAPGFALTLPKAAPGHYRADITYADCPSDSRQFFVAPGEGSSIPKSAELFEGTWTVQPDATTNLVSAGGQITIRFVSALEGPFVSLTATGMEDRDQLWNQATGVTLEDKVITGTITRGAKTYAFTISGDGDRIHCRIVATGVHAKDDEDDGSWTGK